jgi:hypothetical protein
MAATNAYYAITRIPQSGGAGVMDDAVFTGTTPLASGNSATFKLKGGKYALTLVASAYGTVTLQILAQDASTWLNVSSALAANGYSTFDLAAGDYRISLA